MKLETQLKKLENLEVGNVEKAIGKNEYSKYDIEKINDEINDSKDAYKELFMKNFSRIIDNIVLMKNYIFEVGNRTQLKKSITLNVNYKQNSIKIIKEDPNVSCSFNPPHRIIEIFLERQKLKKISLYRTNENGKTQIREGRNQIEFSEKLCDLILGDKSYEEFIYAMNEIPKKISKQYSKIKKDAQSKRESINSDYKKLQHLEVSDF